MDVALLRVMGIVLVHLNLICSFLFSMLISSKDQSYVCVGGFRRVALICAISLLDTKKKIDS